MLLHLQEVLVVVDSIVVVDTGVVVLDGDVSFDVVSPVDCSSVAI